MSQKTLALLKKLTNKENTKLVSRGNKAILYAMRIAKNLGKKRVLIQDQGGWITYKQFPEKLKMELIELKTDYGLIDADELKKKANKNSVLLLNSLAGYFAEQDMKSIYNICIKKKCLLINDVSGSIGTKAAKFGDIIICSFGKDKPLNYGSGGLIAVKNKEWFKLTQIDENDFENSFYNKLLNLKARLSLLKKTNKKIKKDLKDYRILHRTKKGINVIVVFDDDKEKEKLINYCKTNKYEFTLCPRYIRVNENAISIEVKRINSG